MSALTEQDYNDLRPYIPIIRKYREVGQWVSTAGHPTMKRIEERICGCYVNTGCSGCLTQLYEVMNLYLDDYENGR